MNPHRDNFAVRSVGFQRVATNQNLKGPQRTIWHECPLDPMIQIRILHQDVGRRLRARHTKPLDEQHVAGSIQVGQIIDHAIRKMVRSPREIAIYRLFTGRRTFIGNVGLVHRGAERRTKIELILKERNPGIGMHRTEKDDIEFAKILEAQKRGYRTKQRSG